MGLRDRLQGLWAPARKIDNLGDTATTSSASKPLQSDGEKANFGIRSFPPRQDLPLPVMSTAASQHVDIIAVHGLGGNWLKTWTASDGAIWLRDRLPQLLAEKNIQARILSYGYDADFIFTHTVNDIEIVAKDLLNQIDSKRTSEDQKRTPIIFVAHSLGGLVVKAALNKAWTENIDYQNIVEKATGCVFLGVPHRGADLARWARNAATIMRALSGLGNNKLVRTISKSSDEWKKVGWDFVFRSEKISIATIFETKLTGGMMVVNQESARLGIFRERTEGLPGSNHSNICKFGHNHDESDRFLVLGNFTTWVVESALARAVMPSAMEVIEKLAADEAQMTTLLPEHRVQVIRALIGAADSHQANDIITHYPHLVSTIQRQLDFNSLSNELVRSENFIPEQYTVDTMAPRFLDINHFYHCGKWTSYRTWWLQSARRWRRIQVSVVNALNIHRASDSVFIGMAELLVGLTRGGVPLLHFLLDHYLTSQELTGWETHVKISSSSTKGSIDILGLDFLSENFSVECGESHDIDRDLVRGTQKILALGCHVVHERNVAMEMRLTGLACKVRLGGKVCAQKHMCLPKDTEVSILEIEAFHKLQGDKRISELVGVVLDDSQRCIKSFLRSWEPHILSDLLRQSVKASKSIPWNVREKWARQITQAVTFAHAKEVILGKLNLSYFGIDDENNIKLVRIKKKPPSTASGWCPPEYPRNSSSGAFQTGDFILTKESDIFQLGLILWLLTDFSVAIPAHNECSAKDYLHWERRVRPHASLAPEIIELPPCQPTIPLYYQATIKMCRQEIPSNRKRANELMANFPGSSSISPSTDYWHELVYGETEGSPSTFPPPSDRLEDLNMRSVSWDKVDVGEFLSSYVLDDDDGMDHGLSRNEDSSL